ncbi:MAG: type II toxin-antitoxin system RelE/ParE family toxin [Desulfuromonadales bacterium]|nr:type II toxin-antitoxin system RelE/ParE family toxin [Desulfuromonadales bacterium]
MQLKWTVPAVRDLREAGDYIAVENPQAAATMAARILEAVVYLLEYPGIGREGRLADSKELVVTGTPFIVIYRLRSPTVQILRVLHHARRCP